ncbi:helix-turn-helix transcriptional regulator [Acidihalobacter ferrooxydans]|uniref:Helix-turn-helix domain-containing protein n=1 Tax=Acidihalobacter ferrooxydans TaxID=1765967 RepID=A0A1P8UJ21_9GAMM|nr:hypothetical protein [Acidihalobacter ferrooxydans]APZ43845.1 hypothetical protein BW247_12710 [Acidihalobacter ferrooxydans]
MQTTFDQNRIIRNKQAAAFLGVSVATYWRLVRAGTLPQPVKITAQIGGQPLHVLEEFLERLSAGGEV